MAVAGEVDFQTLINLSAGGCLAVMGWFARELWTAVQELKKDLAKLREEIPKEYVPKDEYRSDVIRLHDKLDEVARLLGAKADRKE